MRKTKVPVFIINRNRLRPVEAMVRWLSGFDVDVTIVDNASTYPPLLDWYENKPVELVRLDRDWGHKVLWGAGLLARRSSAEFIVTDPDLDLNGIPPDWLDVLFRGLERSNLSKCGFSLEINDLPDCHPWKTLILDWETKFWKESVPGGGYFGAAIDTTFALYRAGSQYAVPPPAAFRTDRPYTARHLPWYADPDSLDEEERYFIEHAGRSSGYAERMRRWLQRRSVEQSNGHGVDHAGNDGCVEIAPTIRPVTVASGNGAVKPRKDWCYYEWARPELLAMIPESVRHVLDVGCGTGRLGASIRARQPAEVVGLEMDPEAAALAAKQLDRVYHADAETVDLSSEAPFDCVILGDVLEHLRGPEQLLRRVRRWLAPSGQVVASIPNARHHTVVSSLLEGNWTYESAGLLDETHLRFFTRREIEKLFYRAGFDVHALRVAPDGGYRDWCERGRPSSITLGDLSIQTAGPTAAEEFFVYQYLVDARPAERPEHAITSIVIVTWNQLGHTRLCLDSLRQRTDEPYELIFVDNGSTDGTVEYLRSQPDILLIENAENRGFPAAVNQGIAASRGEQVLLLNNDTVVTTGWLDRLLRALYSSPEVGLAGPCSNRVSGAQQVPVSYRDLTGLDGFAWDLGKEYAGQRHDTDRLVGFCLLARRELLDKIGTLDERFGIGNFEDDDYCRRALAAGYRAVIARDSFVHHFGSATFRAGGIDLGAVLSRNRELFRKKWDAEEALDPAARVDTGTAPDARDAVPETSVERMPGSAVGEVAAPPDQSEGPPRLALCMIARDSSLTIGAALQSIRPWVDEMVVVDTGSVDDTAAIAEMLGARVFHFPWCDDFSAARNESLRHARGAWVLWMDSDDTIDEINGRKLRELVNGPHREDVLGYVIQVHCPGGSGRGGDEHVTAVDHVKLLRNRPDLRFEGRIHEQILPAIRRTGGEVAWTDLFVVHSGSDRSSEGRRRKQQRDLRLLELELQDRPNHTFTLFNLGMTYADMGEHEEAAESLRRSLRSCAPGESHVRKAYALLAGSYQQMGQHLRACEACEAGLDLYPQDPELMFRKAMLAHELGRLEQAAQLYETLLCARPPRHFTSIDRGLTGVKAHNNLATVYTDLGRLEEAEAQWRKLLESAPANRGGWQGLCDSLFRQGKPAELEEAIGHLRGIGGMAVEVLLAEAQLAEAQGDPDLARQKLKAAEQETAREEGGESAQAHAPRGQRPLRALSKLLFEHGPMSEAIDAHCRLARMEPDDPSVWHNLGTLYRQDGRYGEAVDAYRRSLRLRPHSTSTHQLLGQALSLQLAPDHQQHRQALAGMPG